MKRQPLFVRQQSSFRRILDGDATDYLEFVDCEDDVVPTARRNSVQRWLDARTEEADLRETNKRPARVGWIAWILRVWFLIFFAWALWIRWRFRLHTQRVKMARASTYKEWRALANVVDQLEGNLSWKRTAPKDDPDVDFDLLRQRLSELRRLYLRGDTRGLVFCLRSGLTRQFAGLSSPKLYGQCVLGTKQIVEDYINVVAFLLDFISKPHESTTDHETLTFLNETRHAYGRTALVLSGGAAMGVHHLGVVKALLDQGMLPMVVSGTSAGSIVAALVGIHRDEELRRIFTPNGIVHPMTGEHIRFQFFREDGPLAVLRRFRQSGVLHDVGHLGNYMRSLFGDISFEEAYKLSGRILNVTVTPTKSWETPMLLNYLTAPHVLVWSAVTASCALPGVFSPVELYSKDVNGEQVPHHPQGMHWADGSIRTDVPLCRLGELFNVNHFVVSQVNPHFVWMRNNWLLQTSVAGILKAEARLRYWQLLQLGLVPAFVRVLFPIFVQPYEGDVTISPELDVEDILRLFINPSVEYTHGSCQSAERRTFEKLEEIRNHCLIENCLERYARRVARRIHKVPNVTGNTVRVRDAGPVLPAPFRAQGGAESPVYRALAFRFSGFFSFCLCCVVSDRHRPGYGGMFRQRAGLQLQI